MSAAKPSGQAESPWMPANRGHPAGEAGRTPPLTGMRISPFPIVLARNGKEHRIAGNPSTVRAGTEIQVLTERPEVSLSVSEMDKDSWILFELPGFANAASGTELTSMDALRRASKTSYFRGEDALWVKLVPWDPELPIRPTVMQESVTISR